MPLVQFGPEASTLTVCPACRGELQQAGGRFHCANPECNCSADFPQVGSQPVLIDFENSIFERSPFENRRGESVIARDVTRNKLRSRFGRILMGTNKTATYFIEEFSRAAKALNSRPKILVVGGGTIGNGVANLYNDQNLDIFSIDVFVSPFTTLVADGHQLPFRDGSFEGVWVQAVLEHVIDPQIVVAEIHRVLIPNGVVYADTPFMQQVHEKAYDFTRFTLSGHRWLFRHFTHIASGASGGAGTAAVWSAKYLIRSITRNSNAGTATMFIMSWLRLFDRFKSRYNNDAASGVYFFGTRAETAISPKEMVTFYETQAAGWHPPTRSSHPT